MQKKYVVRLSEDDRRVCLDIVMRSKWTSERVKRSQMLPKAEAHGPAWFAEAFDRRVQTVERLRTQLVTQGAGTQAAGDPIDAAQHARRVDYEFERNGSASIFMIAEPLSGLRPRRTKVDRSGSVFGHATCRVRKGDTGFRQPQHAHTRGAFYEAFPPDVVRGYVNRIDFCHTPKHGSWLNVAECELSFLTSQCLTGRQIGKLAMRQSAIQISADVTNARQRNGDWQSKVWTVTLH